MDRLFRLDGAKRDHPAVAEWFGVQEGALGEIARCWFDAIKRAGPDVYELVHDGRPTACVEGVAFAYVDAFSAHVNVGFFHGSALADPGSILSGAGQHMRHVKIRPGEEPDADALDSLVREAFLDIRERIDDARDG